jgi:hypothetical protein
MLVMLGVAVKPSSSAGWNWQRIASSAFPGSPRTGNVGDDSQFLAS